LNGSEAVNEILFTEMWIGSMELTRDVEVTEANNHRKLSPSTPKGPGEKRVY